MRGSVVGSLGVFGLGFVALVGGCLGDEPAGSSPGGSDGGTALGPDGAPCEKTCGGRCVATNDVATGCGDPACEPCATRPGARATCDANRRCAFECEAGFDNCDGDAANGCERPVDKDPANCGKCGNVCGNAGAQSPPRCEANKCVFTCQPGFAHCSVDDAAGCDADLNSAANCGTCGHDCLGATCSGGRCGIATMSSENTPTAVTVDATNVYFAVAGTNEIKSAPRTNRCATPPCVKTILGAAEQVSAPTAIATDGVSVFWANSPPGNVTAVRMATVAGASPKDVGQTQGTNAAAMTVAGGRVWWGSRFAHSLYRANVDGTGFAAFGTDSVETNGVAGDATTVFWTSRSGRTVLQRGVGEAPCAVTTGCAKLVPTTSGDPMGIAIDTINVYWADLSGGIWKVARAGGQPAPVASGQGNAEAIVTDGTHVYWGTNAAGPVGPAIRRTPINTPCDGTGCEKIADVTWPNSIAIDRTAVYWVNRAAAGGVYAWAK